MFTRPARNKGENKGSFAHAPSGALAVGIRFAPPVDASMMLSRYMEDSTGAFMRVDRVVDGQLRHYVVHVREPKFTLEVYPDGEAPDKIGAGVIKRVSVPNSWAGHYSQYAALLKRAQEFFRQSLLSEPVPKSETRRLKY